MSDIIMKYKGMQIAKNEIGYRVTHIEFSPIFKTLDECKDFIRFLTRGSFR